MNINRYQDCATTIEMENQSLRPAITKKLTNMEEYSTMKEIISTTSPEIIKEFTSEF